MVAFIAGLIFITKQNIDQLFATKKVDIIPTITEKPVNEIKETQFKAYEED